MKKYYFTVLVAFYSYVVFAQVDPVANFNRHIAANWSGQYVRVSQYQVRGSLYFLGEFFPGMIVYKNGKKISDAKIAFDVYNQKVGIESNGGVFEADELVDSFLISLPEKFGGQKLLFKNSTGFGQEKLNVFFNVLADGEKASFLKLYKSKLSPDPTNTMDPQRKVFEQYYEYYIYIMGKGLQKIKLKEKDVIKALGDEQRFSEYIAGKNLDLSTELGLSQFITQYNSNFQ